MGSNPHATSARLHQCIAYACWYRHATLRVHADGITTCEHFSPLFEIIFHKKPQKPTFPHDAHYKSGPSKVKQPLWKTRRNTGEKSGKSREQAAKIKKQNDQKTNLACKNNTIESKPNVIH